MCLGVDVLKWYCTSTSTHEHFSTFNVSNLNNERQSISRQIAAMRGLGAQWSGDFKPWNKKG
jgi:hypothetical protein